MQQVAMEQGLGKHEVALALDSKVVHAAILVCLGDTMRGVQGHSRKGAVDVPKRWAAREPDAGRHFSTKLVMARCYPHVK